MRLETWFRSPLKSWELDNNLAEADHGLFTWIVFLSQIFNCKITESQLFAISVPKVPHIGPSEDRHRFRRHYVVMPAEVGLSEIWKKMKLLGSQINLDVD